MSVRAISVDFWNTLVDAHAGDPERQERRLGRLAEACHAADRVVDRGALSAAFDTACDRFTEAWLGSRQTPPTDTFVRWIWADLEVSVTDADHDRTVDCFRNVLLDHPPRLAPGAREALQTASERFPLALISDTMLSPGTTIRRLLDTFGILPLFSSFVFSDEVGYSKPDPRAFRSAASAMRVEPSDMMHIGDLRQTDVSGALSTGAKAVLFTGFHHDHTDGPEPHRILESWDALPDLL